MKMKIQEITDVKKIVVLILFKFEFKKFDDFQSRSREIEDIV